MKSNNDISLKVLRKRLVGRWFEDGLYEMYIGLSFIIIGLLVMMERLFRQTAMHPWFGLITPVAFFLTFFLMGKLIRWLKQKYVYPVTGFVKYKKPPIKQRIPRFLVFFSAIFIPTILFLIYNTDRYQIPFAGVVLLYAISTLYYYSRMIRFLVLDVICVLGTGFIFLSESLSSFGIGVVFIYIGPFMILSGGVSFIIFRQRPETSFQVSEEENGASY